MKLKITKGEEPKTEAKPNEEKPVAVKKKLRIKGDKETSSQYGIYSGIVDENGKTNSNPKESEAISNMVSYMKNNNPPESDKPSNVYRPKFTHMAVNYDRKKKMTNS